MRCQSKQIWAGTNWVSNDTQELLMETERSQAQNEDFSFIGAEKRIQATWIQEYNQKLDALKKGMFNSKIGGRMALELLQAQSTISKIEGNPYPLREQFGLPPCPSAPNEDYLSCWHKQWGPETDPQQLAQLNQPNKCFFFYPYTKKGNKSFDGCEKEREAALAANRFKVTNGLVIGGILATVCSMALAFFIYMAQKQDSQIAEKTLQKAFTAVSTQAENTQQVLANIQSKVNALSTQEKTDE